MIDKYIDKMIDKYIDKMIKKGRSMNNHNIQLEWIII